MNVWLNRFRTFDWRNTWPKVVAAVPVIIFILIPVFMSGEVLLNMLVLSGIWAVAAMGFTLILRTGAVQPWPGCFYGYRRIYIRHI